MRMCDGEGLKADGSRVWALTRYSEKAGPVAASAFDGFVRESAFEQWLRYFRSLRWQPLTVIDAVYEGGTKGNTADDVSGKLIPGAGNQGGFRSVDRGPATFGDVFVKLGPDGPDKSLVGRQRLVMIRDYRTNAPGPTSSAGVVCAGARSLRD
jgi:hypothetical protein